MADLSLKPSLVPLHAWLIEAGTSDIATETLFDGFCARLTAAGVPIARGFLSIAGLHPLWRAHSLTWNDGRIVEVTDFSHAIMATALWQASPFRHMLETKTRRLHRRLAGDDAVLDFEVLRIAAAILCADVRGFTNFAEETAPEEVTRRLNDIFDCLGDPVRAAGGEILKFLGDGVLAVFLPPDGADVAVVTPAVLAAAREILARVGALNATETAAGNPALSLDIALHAGEVTYGNIGTADRLDFTVIGPAVNEAARLEGLCKVLGKPILISNSFAQAAEGVQEPLLSVGRHPLRGVREAHEVFTIDT